MSPKWLRRNRTSLLGAILLSVVVFLAILPHRYPYRDYPGTWFQRFVDGSVWRGFLGEAVRTSFTAAETTADKVGSLLHGADTVEFKAEVRSATSSGKAALVIWEGVSRQDLNLALDRRQMPNLSKLANLGVRHDLDSSNWTTTAAAIQGVLHTSPPGESEPGQALLAVLREQGREMLILDPLERLGEEEGAQSLPNVVFPKRVTLPLPGGGEFPLRPGTAGIGVPCASIILLVLMGILSALVASRGQKKKRRGASRIRRGGGSTPKRSRIPGAAALGCLIIVGFLVLNLVYYLRPDAFLKTDYQVRRALIRHSEPAWKHTVEKAGDWDILIDVFPEARHVEAAFPADPEARSAVLESLDRRLGWIMRTVGEKAPVLVIVPWETNGHRRIVSAENWAAWARRQAGREAKDELDLEDAALDPVAVPIDGGTTLALRSLDWSAPAGPEQSRPLRSAIENLADNMLDPMTNQDSILSCRFVDDATAWLTFGPEYWVTTNLDWTAWRYKKRFLPPERNLPFYVREEWGGIVIRRLSRNWQDTGGPAPGGFLFAAGFPRSSFGGPHPVARHEIADQFLAAIPPVQTTASQDSPAEPDPG